MDNNLMNARQHGLLDYAFGTIQLTLPVLVKVNTTAVRTYRLIGLGFTAANALTDTPVGLKPVIPFRLHKTIDEVSLAGQSLLTFAPFIRNDKRALTFHLLFLGAAFVNYLATDYKSNVRR